jgi:hypothetical protein
MNRIIGKIFSLKEGTAPCHV